MQGIEKVIGWAGVIFISIGLFFGGYQLFTVDREEYSNAKEVADELWDNPYAAAQYQGASAVYHAELTFALSILLGGVFAGLLLLGVSRLIDITAEQDDKLYSLLSQPKNNAS